jgi:hypothetical protein
MNAKRAAGKRKSVRRKDARQALKNARKVYEHRRAPKPKAWKKGGHEWSKVLGHFGFSGSRNK